MRAPRVRQLLLLAALAFAGVAMASFGAAAFTTQGGSGPVTLDSIGAPPSALWKVSASPPTYQVNETLVISVGDLLAIVEGTSIAFVNGTELVVLGGLEIAGTDRAPVVLRVVPDSGGAVVSWEGIRASGTSQFVVDHAVLNDSLDLTFANSSFATVANTAYQGRLFIDNASRVSIRNVTMTMTPTDVGRPSLWIENAQQVEVRTADLEGGTGWGGVGLRVENCVNVSIQDVVVRDDNPNLVGLDLIASRQVMVIGFTFTPGKTGGDPNQALGLLDSTEVWVEGLVMTHVGETGLGAIYGIRSNATIANSTFPVGLSLGVWQYPGTLTGLNATRLPAAPVAGATVVEFELIKVEARWSAGGRVGEGSASIGNASWNVSGPISAGETAWLWALRQVNASGSVTDSAAYTASVTCNCTGGQSAFNLTDGWGARVAIFVGDTAVPVAAATATAPRTGEPTTLDATGSFDNAQVAAYLWTAVGAINATGLPCAQAVCEVVFAEPGNFSIELRVIDTSALESTTRLQVSVADATAPQVEILSLSIARPGQNEPFVVEADAQDNDPAFLPQVQWFVDGAPVAADTLTATLRLDAIGFHTVRVVVRDDAGNVGERSVEVEIRDSTPPEVAVWSAPSGLTAPATLEFNGSIGSDNVAVTAWHWRVVGPGTDYNLTGVHPRATLPAAGSYNVTLIVEDAEGNQASRAFALTVAEKPSAGEVPLLLLLGLAAAGAAAAGAAVFLLRRRQDRKAP